MLKTPLKRKRQRKTSYNKRFGFLKSGLSRVVVRKTNKFVNVQLVVSEEAKDKVILSVSSRDLLKFGWSKERKGSLKSIPASYLTGYLAGKRIQEKENGNVILDIGLQRNKAHGRLYAVLKGLVDSGVEIAHSDGVFPSDERVEGKHLKDLEKDIQKVKEKIK
jgi:large subunit ribosomal protein L18